MQRKGVVDQLPFVRLLNLERHNLPRTGRKIAVRVARLDAVGAWRDHFLDDRFDEVRLLFGNADSNRLAGQSAPYEAFAPVGQRP